MAVSMDIKENILKIRDAIRNTPEDKQDELTALIAYSASRVDDVDEAIQLARDAMSKDN